MPTLRLFPSPDVEEGERLKLVAERAVAEFSPRLRWAQAPALLGYCAGYEKLFGAVVDLHTRGGMMNKSHNESVISACISFLLRDARRVSSVNAVIKFPRVLSRIYYSCSWFSRVLNPGDNMTFLYY